MSINKVMLQRLSEVSNASLVAECDMRFIVLKDCRNTEHSDTEGFKSHVKRWCEIQIKNIGKYGAVL